MAVYRLTDPKSASWLPLFSSRFLAKSNSFLIYWSNRAGSTQAFRLNLKNGESVQLTAASDPDPDCLALIPGDRSLCYFDGPALKQVNLSNLKEKEIYRVRDGWRRGRGLAVAKDGWVAAFPESSGSAWQVRLIRLRNGSASTAIETTSEISHPSAKPGHQEILYKVGSDALWLCGFDGERNSRIPTAPGEIGPFFWAPDGKSVLYLNYAPERSRTNSIRECSPGEGAEKLVAPTSQFASFIPNADASIFAGASASKASPNVLLLHRGTRRELTLCEHRASDPARVSPVFSQDSQRIYFQSDHEGNPVIYYAPVEKLVEKTET